MKDNTTHETWREWSTNQRITTNQGERAQQWPCSQWNIVNDVIESPYLVHSLIILYCVDIFYLITAFVVIYRTVIHSLIKDKHTIFKFTFFCCCSSQNWLVCFMTLLNSFVKPLKCFNVLKTWNPLNTSTSKTAWKTDSVCVNMLELS